jgi:hypothetical protein
VAVVNFSQMRHQKILPMVAGPLGNDLQMRLAKASELVCWIGFAPNLPITSERCLA